MHILILSKRNAEAQTRLLRAAEALAVRLELDPALVQALKPTDKDKDVRALKEREGAAALIERLAILAGAMEPPIEEAPVEETAVTAVTETQTATPEEVIPLEGEPELEAFPVDELPAEEPVEKEPEEKPAKKSTAKKPAGKGSKKK